MKVGFLRRSQGEWRCWISPFAGRGSVATGPLGRIFRGRQVGGCGEVLTRTVLVVFVEASLCCVERTLGRSAGVSVLGD